MIPGFVRTIFIRFFWLLVIYSLTRFCFYLGNQEALARANTSEIWLAFLYGIRFDLSAVLFTNAPMLIFWLAPMKWQAKAWWRKADLICFALINLIFIGINVLDIEFYKFMGKRLAWDIFAIQKDIQQQSISVLLSYWKLALVWLVLSFLAVSIYRLKEPTDSARSGIQLAFWRFIVVALVILGMRGGVQFKPLHPMNAYFTTSAELGVLTLNTPFNFLKSRRKWNVPETKFFADEKMPVKILAYKQPTGSPAQKTLKGWNVVIIIIESFSTEYLDYAPFFKSLAEKSYYFNFNYANGRRSIEALPSILCGLPSLMNEPIVSSDFNNNEMHCMGHELADLGYSTHFYHGAYNGSMYMDTFSKRAGFNHFVGFDEYPLERRAKDSDNIWGILDEPFLQYSVEQMDRVVEQEKKPFLLGLFTLSSHHPYYIPPDLRGKFAKGPLEIHESIGYLDYSLKKYFERAEKSPWFNKTIFIMTGDHIQKSSDKRFQNELGSYRVPLLIYIPGRSNLAYDKNRITQHIDIQATVFDLLGVDPKSTSLLGQSVFGITKSYAFNFNGNGWWLLDSSGYTKLNMYTQESVSYLQKDGLALAKQEPLPQPNQEQSEFLKALVQYTIDGIVHNKIYKWQRDL